MAHHRRRRRVTGVIAALPLLVAVVPPVAAHAAAGIVRSVAAGAGISARPAHGTVSGMAMPVGATPETSVATTVSMTTGVSSSITARAVRSR